MIPITRSTPTQSDSSCCPPLASRASRVAAAVARPFQNLCLIAQVFLLDRQYEGFFYALRRVFRTVETIRYIELSFPELMNVRDDLMIVGDTKVSIIREIRDVPREERADAIRYAQGLFADKMDAWPRASVIRKIGHIPGEERADAIRYAQELFTDGMRGDIKTSLIETIGGVPREERAEVIRYVQELFTDRMSGWDREKIIQNVAAVPQANRAAYVQQRMRGEHVNNRVAAQHGVNVHEGKRDQLSETVLRKLWEYQGGISKDQIDQAVKDFKGYIDQLLAGNKARHALVLDALCGKPSNQDYGPLLSNTQFDVSKFSVSGEELIGRLWIFASKITDTEDQENAKQGMISALEKSYETGFDNREVRVCNPGKAQRLIVGVLQGRLKGVNLDIPKLTAGDAMKGFFQKEEHQNIRDLTTLLEAAKQFCKENPAVGEIEAEFLKEIRGYAELQGIGSERSE